ncbi:biotin--[acetyl-CoA-carboxylase] ligase [Candidatus Schneideria nysicola]|uniref:biotin--[acetyl-CoA-carboxylase] ligase n=1 Tax=Candidatus Schneideria nysicola TaxID=1081631 RepID=UPI001FE4474A|nr:biotin--[acetyl-CoA-carboxylase] ligase [Candidatus Schneideria nysicola]
MKIAQYLKKEKIRYFLSNDRVLILSTIDSTNQYLLENLSDLQIGDVCLAEHQTNGRGRQGNQWISPFGKNIYFSLYWSLNKKNVTSTGLSIMVSIIVVDVLQHFGVRGVKIKWPNDLYLNNRKLAGILIEKITRPGNNNIHIIIGIGINMMMNSIEGKMINQKWIALQDIGIFIDRTLLVIKLISTLRQALKRFESDGFYPFFSLWKNLDNYYYQTIKIIDSKKTIIGINCGINNQGALLLNINGKIYPYWGEKTSIRIL